MRELPHDKIIIYVVLVVLLAASTPFLHRMRRSRGRNIVYHFIFVAASAAAILLIPASIQDEIFSPGGVLLLGTLLPVYESVVAACSIGDADDTVWLQFWITSASLSFSTEFMDSITAFLPSAGEHWYEFEFLFNLWLILPMTDGAAIIYDKFTKPYLSPICNKINAACEGYIAFIMTVINTSTIWMIWTAFLMLPEEGRRFLVVVLGTVYPIAASISAIASKSEDSKYNQAIPQWLTYWACFSLQFIAMDYLENFVGHIRGFYTLNVLAVVYLFLPMFNGANAVFRNVLVPLMGQYENMLMLDAYLVKRGMLKDIPEKERDRVFANTAALFLRDKVE